MGAGTVVVEATQAGDFTYAPATPVDRSFTVNPAFLTLNVDNQTKVYGTALPSFSGTLIGLVNGDVITPVYSTRATAASDVVAGGYAITATFNDPNGRLSNYIVTNNPGVLTITRANQTIQWANPADIVYGNPLGAAQLNASVSVIGPAPAGVLIYTPAINRYLQVGNGQMLSVTAAATQDYNATTASVTINVLPITGDTFVLNGTNGNDVIIVSSTGPNSVTAYVNRDILNQAGIQRIIVNGLSGFDVVEVIGLSVPAVLDGGSGSDIFFDVSRGNDILLGGSGPDVLFGGFGADVLVGGASSNVLFAGRGNDILIGGRGQATLFGGRGPDILIGGYTAFDQNIEALSAISAEWNSGRPFDTIVANLRGVGTRPSLNGNFFLTGTGPNATVFSNRLVDTIFGGAGRDWFFASLGGANADVVWLLKKDDLIDRIF
jgi:Ca2+-binding RTX toxin-like protein